MLAAVRFFFKHAGYSWDAKVETRLKGRWRCARAMALAEHEGREYGFTFEWENDWSVDHETEYDCYVDPETGEYTAPKTCEACVCRSEDGKVLASQVLPTKRIDKTPTIGEQRDRATGQVKFDNRREQTCAKI